MANLVVNATVVDSKRSGLGNYAVHLVKELAAIRDDLIVFTSHAEPFVQANVGIRKYSQNLGPSAGLRGHLARLLLTQTVLAVQASRLNPSCLFSLVPEAPLWYAGSQVVVAHDLIPLFFPKEYRLQNMYFRLFVASVLKRVSSIVAVSQRTKQDIVSVFGINPSTVQVVPGGCDHRMFFPGIDPNRVKRKYGLTSYLLYVGNLHPHKNVKRLIAAFKQLRGHGSHQLVIVGEKDPRFFPVLCTQVEKFGLQEKVLFLDFVPQEDLPELYSGAEIFVLPSLYEGFGLPLVEAMACGVPVVTAKGGAMEEVVGDAGKKVDPTNVNEMVEAMSHILESPGLKDTLSERGLRQAKKYSWSATATAISRVLDESKS